MIDLQEIESIVSLVKDGGTILYPTDTVWGIGGDSSNSQVIKKIYELKKRSDSKSLVSLVNGIEMLERITYVSKEVKSILNSSTKPTTIIYSNVDQIHPLAKAEDGSAAIRIVNDEFCQQIISRLGIPLLSTSANISGLSTPSSYSEITDEIKASVDFVAFHKRNEFITTEASRILKVNGEEVIVIRD